MPGTTIEAARSQRIEIAARLNMQQPIKQISRELGCSANTVRKVRETMQDPNQAVEDDRRDSNGRPHQFTAETKQAVLQMREQTELGPRLMWALMKRDPERWGIVDPDQLPSVDTIHEWITEAGMTKKLVGSKDRTGFPIDFEDKPGIIAMDEWGPRTIRGERIFLVTAGDRFTRLSFGVPVFKKGSASTWMKVIDIARENLLAGAAPTALWIDNGIGMALASGHTSQPIRYALAQGTRVVFNAPHMPWKNGRLENWHYRQEAEYWRHIDSNKTTVPEAIKGFLYYVNWYNMERPHGSLDNHAPADLAPHYVPISQKDISRTDYAHLDPQAGIIDMVRMVRTSGHIELQDGESMRVSEVFGGQFLRIRFHVSPTTEHQIGECIWQRGQTKQPLTVATFNHLIDRTRKITDPLVTNVNTVDFDANEDTAYLAEVRPQLDEFMFDKAAARIGKRQRKPTVSE